jgi:hypothetical protein
LTDVNIRASASYGVTGITLDIQNNTITQNTMVVLGKSFITMDTGVVNPFIFENNEVENNTGVPLY